MVVIKPLSTRLTKPNFCFDLSHRCSTAVSLETRNPSTAITPLNFLWETRVTRKEIFLSHSVSMVSPHFFHSPCPTTILCSMTEFTNKFMAVRRAVLSAPLWPIFAQRRWKSLQSVIHPFPPKFGKGTSTTVFEHCKRQCLSLP